MRTCGVICEYNPFHNGHKYQLEVLKSEYDAVVCVMSGSFVQRGDVAIFDKWTRAKAALLSGADLVIELPVAYSISSAEGFAMGGVKILDSLGVVDSLGFGCECAEVDKLKRCAEVMMNEPEEVSRRIRELAATGTSFAKAQAMAYAGVLDEDIISKPNNILALEYIKALKRIESNIKPFAIERKGTGYHDMHTCGEFASATLLREMMAKGEDISEFVPFDFSGCESYDINRLTDAFKYKLIKEGAAAFCGIADIEPGLDNRFLKALDKESLTEIIDFVKTKRYTRARLCRIAVSVLLGIKGGFCEPEYVRVLGMTDAGKELLFKMKKTCSLPVVNKVADFKNEAIKTDILATDLAGLCASRKVLSGRDYKVSSVII